MTGNTSTAVSTCQFSSGPLTYCSISSIPPTSFNVSNNFYYSTPQQSQQQQQQPQHSFLLPQLHQQQQHHNDSSDNSNTYYTTYSNFYDTSSMGATAGVNDYGYTMLPKTSNDFQYEHQTSHQLPEIARRSETSDDGWSHGDSHSSSQLQQPDPCAHVVQVLQCYHQGGEEPEFVRKAIESLVKKLKDKRTELDALISAVTSGGKEQTSCVTIQRSLDGRLQVAGRKGVPHVVYARIWRWPNVSKNELQKMDICHVPNDHQDLICINPFHYERVVSSGYGNIDLNSLNQLRPASNSMEYQSSMMGMSMATESLPGNHLNGYSQLSSNSIYSKPMSQMQVDGGSSSSQPVPGYPMNMSNGYGIPSVQDYNMIPRPKPNSFLMYGPNQQPSCVITHQPDGQKVLVNQSLPTYFKNDYQNNEWKSQYSNGENAPLIERYTALKYIMHNEPFPQLYKSDGPYLSDWCSITYYELDTQIGETFNVPVHQPEIVVDGGMNPDGTRSGRICLGALSNVHRTEASERARMGIGRGIKLKHLPDGSVALECLSDKGVFLRSYYMDFENNVIYGSTVHKFASGANKKIFDLKWAYTEMFEQRRSAQKAFEEQQHAIAGTHAPPNILDRSAIGVDDLRRVCCTIAISFVKGWGTGYTRASIKETPCWIELQLHRPLQLLNNLLKA